MRTLLSLPIPVLGPVLGLALGLSGCALFQGAGGDRTAGAITGPSEPQPETEVTGSVRTTALGATSVRAETLDRTTAAEKAAALATPAAGGERELGKTVVALGPPAEQGIWLSSPLVKAVAEGRIVTASGQSLGVELRPGTGGALLSLSGFQALGLSLTELSEVTVFGP
jgi:hypothetical protein